MFHVLRVVRHVQRAVAPHLVLLAAHSLQGILPHLREKAAFVAVAKASIGKVEEFRRGKGWSFTFVSSAGNSFNADYGVERPVGEKAHAAYNYGDGSAHDSEQWPGISVFRREGDQLYHTYSAYARGLDQTNAFHAVMDLLPYGRDGFCPKHKEDYAASAAK